MYQNGRQISTTFGPLTSLSVDYPKQYTGHCSSKITSYTECNTARIQMGLSGTSQGSWSYLPYGCSMWGDSVHYNTHTHDRACDYSSSTNVLGNALLIRKDLVHEAEMLVSGQKEILMFNILGTKHVVKDVKQKVYERIGYLRFKTRCKL